MPGKHSRIPRAQRHVETSDYVAMMLRIITAYGDRVAEDPVALVHLRDLEAALTEQANRGIFEANRNTDGYSQRHIAAMLGVSQPAIVKRVKIGEVIYAKIAEARGGGALVRIKDVRARRAALMAQADVIDTTGSEREKAAGM